MQSTNENEPADNAPPPAEIDATQGAREILDQLNQQQRITNGARMLPDNTPLTDDETHDVIDAFAEHLDLRGIPRAKVAKEIPYSAAVISAWEKRKYRGDSDAVTREINLWIDRDKARAQAMQQHGGGEIRTTIAQDIRTFCRRADAQCMMLAIVSPSGTGKTMVLRALEREMNGVFVTCTDGMTSRDLLLAIARALRYEKAITTRGELTRVIIAKLKDTRRVLFIDEAQLAGKHLGCLRSIHDQAQVPIVMAGTAEIISAIDDSKNGDGQFMSRTMRYSATEYARFSDGPDGGAGGRLLFSIDEIRAFFASMKIRVDRDGTRMLHMLACLDKKGALRAVRKTIETILDACPGTTLITRDLVLLGLQSLWGAEAMVIQDQVDRRMEAMESDAVAKAG